MNERWIGWVSGRNSLADSLNDILLTAPEDIPDSLIRRYDGGVDSGPTALDGRMKK